MINLIAQTTPAIHTPAIHTSSNSALVVFALYAVIVFALAGFAQRLLAKRKFLGEYFLGSRGLGTLALALTFTATSASAGSFVGFPALVYAHGWVLALWISSYMIFGLCAMGLLGKRLNYIARVSGAITLPDVLRNRFNSPVLAIIATSLIALLLGVYLIPQFKVGAQILHTLLSDVPAFYPASDKLASITHGLPYVSTVDPEYLLCLLMFSLLVILYTAFGGFRAVVWTDILQGFVMIFGVIVMLVLALWQVGGLSNATEKMAQMTPPQIGQVVFESDTPAAQNIRIVSESWIEIPSNEGPLLIRINETAIIKEGDVSSIKLDDEGNNVGTKAVQITTPAEIKSIRESFEGLTPGFAPPSLPAGITPRILDMQPYAYGANRPGVYLTAPGPSPTLPVGFLSFGLMISFFFRWAISGAGQPGNMVRLMAFNSVASFKKAIAVATLYFAMIYIPLVIIFCCARVLMPGMEQDPDRVMPLMAFSLASAANAPWLAGLIVAAPFAAAMSTVDSFMLMISSSFVRDIYQNNINPHATEKTLKRLSYACTLIIGVTVTFVAMKPPMFLEYLIVFTGGGLTAAFLIPIAMTLYWPRANTYGTLAAMLGGAGLYVALYLPNMIEHGAAKPMTPLGLDPLVWSLLASILVGITVTNATPPPDEKLVQKYF